MTDKQAPASASYAGGGATPEVYYTESEAAELLRLSRRTLQRWRQEGTQMLPFRRFGGLIRYAQSDIDAWATKQSRLSTSEVV